MRKENNHRWDRSTADQREELNQRGDVVSIYDSEGEIGQATKPFVILIEVPGEKKADHPELFAAETHVDTRGVVKFPKRVLQLDMVSLRASMSVSERGGFDTGRCRLSRSDGMTQINAAKRTRPKA